MELVSRIWPPQAPTQPRHCVIAAGEVAVVWLGSRHGSVRVAELGDQIIHKLLVLVCLAVGLAEAALAQNADGAAVSGVVVIPEEDRGGLIGIEVDSHMEVTLDDQMRIATLEGGPMPAEADFDASGLSRTEETFVAMGSVNHWAAPGRIGFSLLQSGDQTNLKVSNNTDLPIAYIVALYRGEPQDQDYNLTTTCAVPARRVSVETWPYHVDGLVIVRVLPPPPSDKAMCIDPTESIENPRWYSLDMQ